MDCVIGCDVGSQGVKAVLLSVGGKLVGEASAGYTIEYPHPTWAEQSAEVWLTAAALGQTAGLTTVLVLSGETRAEDPADSPDKPTCIFDPLGAVANWPST